jgi:hypothetical protein
MNSRINQRYENPNSSLTVKAIQGFSIFTYGVKQTSAGDMYNKGWY